MTPREPLDRIDSSAPLLPPGRPPLRALPAPGSPARRRFFVNVALVLGGLALMALGVVLIAISPSGVTQGGEVVLGGAALALSPLMFRAPPPPR